MNQDDIVKGSDGTLIAEFRAMEAYHRLAIAEDSYSSTLDSFPCHALYDRNYMACLDIGAAGTFSGDTDAPAIDWEVAADAQWYKNVSRDYLNMSTATGRNLFGITCAAEGGGNTQHGDGIINSFDIGVLIFTMFGDYPYNNISDYATTITVDQRPETQSRCGNAEARADWQADLSAYDYCPSDEYSTRQRRKLAIAHANDIYNEPLVTVDALAQDDHWNMPSDTDDQGNKGTHPIDKGWVRTRHDGDNSQGSWHTFEFAPTIVTVIVELILHGVWSEGQAILSNAPPPADGDDVPIWPLRHQVRWSRTDAQRAFAAPGTECNPVVSGATGTQTLIGDTLSVRQEGRGSNCPFQLHLWTPIDSPRARPGRQLAIGNENAELVDPYRLRKLSDGGTDPRTVWATRGSSAMTTTGPVVLNPSNTYELAGSPKSPPPPSPPPMAPIEYTRLEVEIKFTSTNVTDAQALVDALLEQKTSIDDQLYEFVINITTIASLTSIILAPNETSAAISTVMGDQFPLSWATVGDHLPLLYPAAIRRLSEVDCEDAAVLKVTIAFDGVVLGDTIKTLQDSWPAPLDDWGVNICGNITFAPTEALPPEDDTGVNVLLLAIILTVAGLALIACCCTVIARLVLQVRARLKNNNNDYYRMNLRGPPYDVGTFTATESRASNAAHNADDWTWSSLIY